MEPVASVHTLLVGNCWIPEKKDGPGPFLTYHECTRIWSAAIPALNESFQLHKLSKKLATHYVIFEEKELWVFRLNSARPRSK